MAQTVGDLAETVSAHSVRLNQLESGIREIKTMLATHEDSDTDRFTLTNTTITELKLSQTRIAAYAVAILTILQLVGILATVFQFNF